MTDTPQLRERVLAHVCPLIAQANGIRGQEARILASEGQWALFVANVLGLPNIYAPQAPHGPILMAFLDAIGRELAPWVIQVFRGQAGLRELHTSHHETLLVRLIRDTHPFEAESVDAVLGSMGMPPEGAVRALRDRAVLPSPAFISMVKNPFIHHPYDPATDERCKKARQAIAQIETIHAALELQQEMRAERPERMEVRLPVQGL